MTQSPGQPVFLQCDDSAPAEVYLSWVRELDCYDDDLLIVVPFRFSEYWREDGAAIELNAIYAHLDGQSWVSVTDATLEISSESHQDQYALWAREHGFAQIKTGAPVALAPVDIPKPWGREIWFTGVEARGVCAFSSDTGKTPVPWLQAAMSDMSLGLAGQPLVLLKILDPSPEPVTGDLYFELHQEKREVYVVTHVDNDAWPDGVGSIRYGFDPQRVAEAESDTVFRAQYLDSVKAYEKVRREIDALDVNVEPSSQLQEQEQALRAEMDSYSLMRPLQVGDVVKVPLLLPHSLQHGVRTVEFQTPVYERKILSFAQQVLTQDHWDTAEAVAQMTLLAPPEEAFPVLPAEEGVRVERIVDFDDFEVWRVRLEPGSAYQVPVCASYRVLMVLVGVIDAGSLPLVPEQAALLSASSNNRITNTQADKPAIFLLASPRC